MNAEGSDGSLRARADTYLQQTLLGDAAEHAEVGVCVWNEEMRYVAVNQRVAEIFGVTREEMLGSRVGDHNQTDSGRSAIDAVLDHLPATGRTLIRPGLEVDWVVVESRLAGLPHFFGVFWEAAPSDD
jgi:PAS domain-containing protein